MRNARDAIRAGAYPREHRDPFGRVLAAQTIVVAIGKDAKAIGVTCLRATYPALAGNYSFACEFGKGSSI